ncbi:MAG: FtsW/RodA/SpoVE family cell cycle protein [Lachnospiraceae bacterium]|nr:FtsW/RodA/SpoVE family cell cycle protein [Lachnospiraceae bacterium]
MINRIKQYDWKRYNVSLLGVVVILCSISAVAVRLAGGEENGTQYMKGQIMGICMGLLVILILSVLDYHFICQLTGLYYIVGVALVAATYTSLGDNNGTDARRWISFRGLPTFQPTELMKIILILVLAVVLTKRQTKMYQIRTMLIVLGLTLVPLMIVMRQPDLSSSLVMAFFMVVMLFAAGISYRIIVPIILLAIPAGIVGFWYIQQPDNKLIHGYHYNRIMSWLYPSTYPDAERYNFQQLHSIRSIASGKIYGKFLQDGGSAKAGRDYSSVAVRESDFIWSVIGEEFGFLGCCLILLLLAIVIFKCFSVARKAQDFLGKMIAVGVASMYMFQVFTNISVATFIFPNTGLPLPFLSNGLSSMLSSMIGIGLIMNIAIQPAKSSKGGFSMRNMYGRDADRSIDVDLEL